MVSDLLPPPDPYVPVLSVDGSQVVQPLSGRAKKRAGAAKQAICGSKSNARRNALHVALSANDSAEALRLIEDGDEALLSQQSVNGTTPLMLLAMGHCEEKLLWRLLERRACASVAARSGTRRTAADYAEDNRRAACPAVARSAEVVEVLRKLESEEVQRTAHCRCPVCGDVVGRAGRRPNLAFLFERAERGEEDNGLLQRFFAHAGYRALLEPRHHRINDHRQVRKELSESMAILEALEDAVPSFGSDWHVIDLCCGRSVTSVLLAYRHPGVSVTTVDRLEPKYHPHLEGMEDHGVRYVRLDVMCESFIASLDDICAAVSRPVAILGMHLCGQLSLRAIETFQRLFTVEAIVLSPCCLPLKDDPLSPKHIYVSKDDAAQYEAWSMHLEDVLRSAADRASVSRASTTDILSPKNVVLCATRSSPATRSK